MRLGRIPAHSAHYRSPELIRVVSVMVAAAACGADGDAPPAPPPADTLVFWGSENDLLSNGETEARRKYSAQRITVRGRVFDDAGRPVSGASVELGDKATLTGTDGSFQFADVLRQNRQLAIDATGYRQEIAFPHLAQPIGADTVELSVFLAPRDPNVARFMFTGDVMLGRRFLDPSEMTLRGHVPPDDPTALISVADPEPGSRESVRHVRSLFADVDFPVVNFESPVTDSPVSPHPTKDQCFFTLPASLAMLDELGVRYVSLGNNHIFDYQLPGLTDTKRHLRDRGVSFSGAGATPQEAFAWHAATLAQTPYALLAMSGVSGSEHEIRYVASDTQGGAADLRDSIRVAATIADARAQGNVVIAQLHQGREYTYEPSAYSQDRLAFAAGAGASLLVAHHPHIAQGFGFVGAVPAIHSLGNFIFDSDRVDAMLGLVARVDMRGASTERIQAYPVYIEDYRPRPITSWLGDPLFRRVAEFSVAYGADAHADGGVLRVTPQSTDQWEVVHTDYALDVDVPSSGELVIDLRAFAPSTASLASLTFPGQVQLGRDLLVFGDFEDTDVDDDLFELARWDVEGTLAFPCVERPYRGAAALCLRGTPEQTRNTAAALRNRVRVMGDADDVPVKDLSLVGYVAFENSGELTIRADYYAEGSAQVGREELVTFAGGTAPWTFFEFPIHMPADTVPAASTNARALRIFFRQQPPVDIESMTRVDELAIVSWERSLSSGVPTVTPHAYDFARVRAPAGRYALALRFAERRLRR